MSKTRFEAPLTSPKVVAYGTKPILVLSNAASMALPSRGMVVVAGTANGFAFQSVVEPDGNGSHWFQVDEAFLKGTGAKLGDTVIVELEPIKEWPEPKVPADLQAVLEGDAVALAVWNDITVMARWDWIRWIGAVKQAETRKKRVESIPSRLMAGKRRPCCFDRSQCTLTEA